MPFPVFLWAQGRQERSGRAPLQRKLLRDSTLRRNAAAPLLRTRRLRRGAERVGNKGAPATSTGWAPFSRHIVWICVKLPPSGITTASRRPASRPAAEHGGWRCNRRPPSNARPSMRGEAGRSAGMMRWLSWSRSIPNVSLGSMPCRYASAPALLRLRFRIGLGSNWTPSRRSGHRLAMALTDWHATTTWPKHGHRAQP